MEITQQQLRDWRAAYQQQAEAALLSQSRATAREQQLTKGRDMCLGYFIQSLDFLDESMLTSRQVEEGFALALAKLADTKLYYLIEYVHCPQQRDATEEDIWWAEGILLQVDQVREELLKILPAEWKPAERVWGHYYQIFHYRDFCPPWSIDEVILHWQDPAHREQVFEEVGIVRLDRNGEVLACLDAVFACSNSGGEDPWSWNKEAYWIRPGEYPRSTSIGDVIVPGLGPAWMVDCEGFRLLPDAFLQPEEQQISRPPTCQPGGILARLKKVWGVLLGWALRRS